MKNKQLKKTIKKQLKIIDKLQAKNKSYSEITKTVMDISEAHFVDNMAMEKELEIAESAIFAAEKALQYHEKKYNNVVEFTRDLIG